jgi:NADH-quinone oxidoreductase subunit M
MQTLLLIAVLLPLAVALLPGGDAAPWRWRALVAALAALAPTAILLARYPPRAEEFAATDIAWLAAAGVPADVRFHIALDGLSLWLFGLTALLTVVAVLISWEAIRRQQALYYRLLLVLETGMLGVFVARDIILFYLFFEFTLVPLFFLIGIWGSQQRRYAAIKFFLFTLTGSVLTLLGLLAVVLWDHYHYLGAGEAGSRMMTFSIPELTRHLAAQPMDAGWQFWIFLALFAGFAVKVPLVPLHTWLPLAHVEAPAAGSVLLAGVLLKVGAYGFVRFNLPMLPAATAACMPWLLWLAPAGIVYGALVALAQSDMKRLIAYSSVSHLGFCMLGVFAVGRLAVEGGVLQMVNHGLATGGLFAVVGMIYDRYHTRQIADLGGLARRTPLLASFAVVLALASIGLPGTGNFAGEFLILLGMFQRGWADAPPALALQYRVISIAATSGVVLGAWYMLGLVLRVFFGPLREPAGHAQPPARDLAPREVLALAPLVALIVWIGVQPSLFLDRMAPTLDRLTAGVIERLPSSPEGTAVTGQGRRPGLPRASLGGTNTADDDTDARLRAFPPQAVFGLAFTPGWRERVGRCPMSAPFTGLLFPPQYDGRNPVNGVDMPVSMEKSVHAEPGVNAGPSTGCAGKGRKRPWEPTPVNSSATTATAPCHGCVSRDLVPSARFTRLTQPWHT